MLKSHKNFGKKIWEALCSNLACIVDSGNFAQKRNLIYTASFLNKLGLPQTPIMLKSHKNFGKKKVIKSTGSSIFEFLTTPKNHLVKNWFGRHSQND